MIAAYVIGGVATYAAFMWAYCRYDRDPHDAAGVDLAIATLAILPGLLWPLAWVVAAVVAFIRRK